MADTNRFDIYAATLKCLHNGSLLTNPPWNEDDDENKNIRNLPYQNPHSFSIFNFISTFRSVFAVADKKSFVESKARWRRKKKCLRNGLAGFRFFLVLLHTMGILFWLFISLVTFFVSEAAHVSRTIWALIYSSLVSQGLVLSSIEFNKGIFFREEKGRRWFRRVTEWRDLFKCFFAFTASLPSWTRLNHIIMIFSFMLPSWAALPVNCWIIVFEIWANFCNVLEDFAAWEAKTEKFFLFHEQRCALNVYQVTIP